MSVSAQSRAGDEQQIMEQMQRNVSSQLRVALPGIIQSFDPDTVTAVVQPALKGSYDGKSLPLPLLVDVPVIFPRGGGCTLTFPVTAGDECLLIFGDRCIDFWWQNGGIQEPVDQRQHDLSDGFAIVGPQSQAKKISGISMSGTQLRTDDGAAFIEVATGHDITVTTPGKLTASATGGAEITAPEIVLNGNVTINGNLSQGMGEGGGTATMQGPITVTNDVTAGGKSVMGHKHQEHDGPETGEPI
ncbi:hypothetical protein DEO48_25305 [Enterobacter sp. CGMCC 5087]|uniref:Gp138 family membrane-puncturing spike protein n=1 Tax=Enterobacter sp. CGMCC 5087 TaxID=2183878 RepID=UPI000D67A4E4|nr:Gp138 family membrane-puncturing spike protein [Enterobacter sp. CGMCC 5087]PWI77282.1 hypothetical protein DEO48_25305 [Enterobacter sp. CGMCC 5087]